MEGKMFTEKAASPFTLPFPSRLSLAPLLVAIERIAKEQGGTAVFARELLQRLQEVPALYEPIDQLDLLEEHRELVDLILSFVVPTYASDQYLTKISRPFSMDDIYISPRLVQLLHQRDVEYELNRTDNILFCATLVKAGSMILNKFYGQKLAIDPPIQITIKEKDELLPRFYKAHMDTSYVDVKLTGERPELSQQEINELLSNIYDTERWLKALPIESFEFQGFIMVNMLDITTEEALSQIKHHLLSREAVLDQANVQELETLMQIYLGIPDLRLGITAIDYPRERAVAHQYKIRFDFLSQEIPDLLHERYQGSIYEKACQFRETLLVEDVAQLKHKTELEERLLAQGLRALIVTTLLDNEDNVIGIVELGSRHAYGLHSFTELKFKEIVGLFRTAVQRSREEVDNAIEAIIREQYTALHESVEWRFIEESFNILEARSQGNTNARGNAIVFKDVYPLYGQADIVGSSLKRNEAIRADLITDIKAARAVLSQSQEVVNFPLVNQALFQLNSELPHLQDAYNSSDETRIVEFMHQEIHPLLRQLMREYRSLVPAGNQYFQLLDKDLGIVYDKRQRYEKSVEAVNDLIGCYLDSKDEALQKILPHYFERYKTDGVEYNLYLGESLLRKKGVFSDIHLRNFRLSQLIQMCEITRRVEEKRHEWPEPLTTAQLVFAYTSPLSIRFRMDEKRFDVDGAYNVRYEILKKRIDKAVIATTGERITQPGHVAMVYLQEKDRQEYEHYASYLLHQGFITDPPEDFELAPLQGVLGLRALRMQVKL